MSSHGVGRSACDNCRGHKIRCIRKRSNSCERCARNQLICRTSPSRPPGRPSNVHRENLRGNLEAMPAEPNPFTLLPEQTSGSSWDESLNFNAHSPSVFMDSLNGQVTFEGLESNFSLSTASAPSLTLPKDPMDALWTHSQWNHSSIAKKSNQGTEDRERTSSVIHDLRSSSIYDRPGSAYSAGTSPACLIALLSDISRQIDQIKHLSWDMSQVRLTWLDLGIESENRSLQNPLEMVMWTTMKYMLVLQILTPSDLNTPPMHQATTPIKLVVISTYLQLLDLLSTFLSQVQQTILDHEMIPTGAGSQHCAFRYHIKGTMELLKHHLVLIENYLGLPKDLRYWAESKSSRGVLNVQEASVFEQLNTGHNADNGAKEGICVASKLQSTIESLSALLN